ncbi:alpha/beta hydrolase fold domain-containing protein [Nocardia sp. NPDC055321]
MTVFERLCAAGEFVASVAARGRVGVAERPDGVRFADGGRARYNLVLATVRPGRELALDLYTPPAGRWPGPRPTVVYIHGGAFAAFDRAGVLPTLGLRSPVRIFAELVDRGYAVASLDYRLSGEARFPEPLHDVKAGVRWLRAEAGRFNLDPDRFASWGESAGGWFSAMLATTADGPSLEGPHGPAGVSSRVRAAVDWYGPTDFARMDEHLISPVLLRHDVEDSPESRFLGHVPSRHPALNRAASPLTYVTPTTAPMLIQHGTADHIVPPHQSRLLSEALTAARVPHELILYPRSDHLFLGDGVLHPTRVTTPFFTFLESHLAPTT